MTKTNAQRQKDYRHRAKERGLKRVIVWIPSHAVKKLLDLARELRASADKPPSLD